MSLTSLLSQYDAQQTPPAPQQPAPQQPAPQQPAQQQRKQQRKQRTRNWTTLHQASYDGLTVLHRKSINKGQHILCWTDPSKKKKSQNCKITNHQANYLRGNADSAYIALARQNGAPPSQQPPAQLPAPPAPPAQPPAPPANTKTITGMVRAWVDRILTKREYTVRQRQPIVDEQGNDLRPVRLPAWSSSQVEEISWSDLMKVCSTRTIGLNDAWMCAWWSMIARTPLMLCGMAGDGKTMLCEMLARMMLDALDAVVQMNPYSEPAELLGATSLRGLDHDLIAKSWMDAPIASHVLLIDEFEKASEGLQQALLSLLNERVLRDAGRTFELPLELLLATSNGEIYENAVRDRFSLSIFTKRLGDEYTDFMLDRPFNPPFNTDARVTSQQLARWRDDAEQAMLSLSTDEALRERFKQALKYVGAQMSPDGKVTGLSNRRQEQIRKLVGAVAATQGRNRAQTSDLIVLQFLAHSEAQQQNIRTYLQTTLEIQSLDGYEGIYYSTIDQTEDEARSALLDKGQSIMSDLGIES